jgi:hypothetical protein
MSRSELERVVFVDDGVFVAVILGGRHDADLPIDLKKGDGTMRVRARSRAWCCARLRSFDIVRLHPLAGPIPARWRPFEPVATAVTSEAQLQRSQLV